MDTLGDIVRRGREAKGWTYGEADEATGVPIDTWKGIETRGRDPRLTTVQKLVEGLGIPPEDLVNAPVGPARRGRLERKRRARRKRPG